MGLAGRAIGAARRSRAPKGEGERLREEILAATERLLLESGDESAVSIRAIAGAVGVTPPSLYLHFADKEELIHAVCQRRFAELEARIEAEVQGVHDPVEQLRRRGRAYVAFGVENPEHYRILFLGKHAFTREDFEAGVVPGVEGFRHLVANVEAGMASGAFAPADSFLVACGLWAVVHGITSLRITVTAFPLVDSDALTEHVLDVAIRGLAPR